MELNAQKCKVMDITHAALAHKSPAARLNTSRRRSARVHLPKDPKCNQYAEVARERERAQESGGGGTHLGVFRTARKEKRVAAYGQCRRNISIAKPILFYGSPAWNPDTRKKISRASLLGARRAVPFIYASHLPQRER
jgi:hypothetical protein